MKKGLTLVFVLAILLSLTGTALGSVPAPGGPFNSAFRVQNLEATIAQCVYEFFDAAGVVGYTSPTVSVNPGDSLNVYVPDLAVASGEYSAVVSCDKKVAAVSNFSDANSGASYGGVSELDDTWYAPGIYDNYYNFYSNITVQNATAGLVDVTVDIYAPGNAVPVKTQTAVDVPASASTAFEQEGLPELANNQFYSAVIKGFVANTSTPAMIAPIVNIYGRAGADNQLYSYNAFASGSTTAYAPVIMKNYYGYNTSLSVQNIGTINATVEVEYTNGFTTNHTVAPGAAVSLYTPSVAGLPSGPTLYGATVTSTNAQPLVVLVNESNAYNRAASYSGFSAGSTEVRAPIVEKRYYQYNSSVTCQNVGAAAATMTIAYATGSSGPTVSPSIAVGGTHLFYQVTDPHLAAAPPNYISSATITSAQPIVCVVNQDKNEGAPATTVMDQLYAYNGINP